MDMIEKILADRRIDWAFRAGLAYFTHRPMPPRGTPEKNKEGRPMKVYTGRRDRTGAAVVRVMKNGDAHELRGRQDIVRHAAQFGWGFLNDEAAQLSLAILADALGDDYTAKRLHEGFSWRVVSKLNPREPWRLTELQVMGTVKELVCK